MKDKGEVCISQYEDYRWSENTDPSIRNLGERRRGLISFALTDFFLKGIESRTLEGWLDFRTGKDRDILDRQACYRMESNSIHLYFTHSLYRVHYFNPYKTRKIMGCMFSCILIPRYLERRQGDELLLRFISTTYDKTFVTLSGSLHHVYINPSLQSQ